jgi:hypothetical protein
MYKSISAISAAAMLGSLVMGSTAQAQSARVSLSALAARSSYNLQWLLPERSVRLYRPGLVIVIRPGERQYEVNNRVEFSDAAPVYVNGDMLVSTSLASRLRRLAAMAYVPPTRTNAASLGVRFTEAPAAAAGPVSIDARPLQGSEAIAVTGRAPAGVPVTITLLATISPDLPTVVVSRHDVQADTNGQFQAVIPTAADYLRGSLLRVVATSAGATPASATVTLGAPNAGVAVPFDKPYCPNTDPTCPHY